MLPLRNPSWALERCRGHQKVAQDFEVNQGWFVPIPACPLAVHRSVLSYSSPQTPTITNQIRVLRDLRRLYLQVVRCYKLLLESAPRQKNWDRREHVETGLNCGARGALGTVEVDQPIKGLGIPACPHRGQRQPLPLYPSPQARAPPGSKPHPLARTKLDSSSTVLNGGGPGP